MKCTTCGAKLDARKKKQYKFASYKLQSKGFLANLTSKDYWVFCNSKCKSRADSDWVTGNFEELHGHKKIDFKP
jgi:hypothetical protein